MTFIASDCAIGDASLRKEEDCRKSEGYEAVCQEKSREMEVKRKRKRKKMRE